MEIKRDAYLEKLKRKENNGLVKVITGVRRCGKSYLLLNLFHKHLVDKGVKEDHIIEVALDDIKYSALRDSYAMFEYVEKQIADDNLYYVILDEVQLLDNFVDVLNGFLHIKNVDVYVTGSNSKFLSSDVVTEFRGRGDEVRIFPLSFGEFSTVHSADTDEIWDDYVSYGGLPFVSTLKEPEEKEEYLISLFKEVYLTDLMERHSIRDEEEFGELIDVLASSVGSLTNPSKLSNTFKTVKNKSISDGTIAKYIDYLQDAFLINKAVRFDIKGKRYIGSPVKYYFEDVGLRNARLNFRQVEENRLMENILYNELRYRGYRVDVGTIEVYGRDNKTKKTVKKNYEVDFIANKGGRKYYIQSAFAIDTAKKEEQEKRSLLAVSDSFTKIITVGGYKKPRYDENGIITIGIQNFLSDSTLM